MSFALRADDAQGELMSPWTEVMSKWKAGELKSGGSGKKVKSQKQAVAIMLSEKRESKHKPEYKGHAHSYDSNRPKRPLVSRYK